VGWFIRQLLGSLTFEGPIFRGATQHVIETDFRLVPGLSD
jgi:hypothetical protein